MAPAMHLWQLFTLVELVENMRQNGDPTFVDILNALRIGELTGNQIAVLMERVSTDMEGEVALEKKLRIYPTNNQVNLHNKRVIEYFRKKHTELFTITAQDQLVDAVRKHGNTVTLDSIISKDVNKTGGMPKELEIFVGAKVMLRSNIDVSKGLVNGAMGHITEIKLPLFRKGQVYKEDIPSVYIDFGIDVIHSIDPKSVQFPVMYSYGTAEQRMLPLILSWASIIHKMQGTTVNYAVVYLGQKLFAEGQAYASLSRVRSLNGLCIEELDNSKLTGKKPCNNDMREEINRMRNIIWIMRKV